MKRSAMDGLALALHCKVTLAVGVSGNSILELGFRMVDCSLNSQPALPTRKPLTPSLRMDWVALANGRPVAGSINPQCSEI